MVVTWQASSTPRSPRHLPSRPATAPTRNSSALSVAPSEVVLWCAGGRGDCGCAGADVGGGWPGRRQAGPKVRHFSPRWPQVTSRRSAFGELASFTDFNSRNLDHSRIHHIIISRKYRYACTEQMRHLLPSNHVNTYHRLPMPGGCIIMI